MCIINNIICQNVNLIKEIKKKTKCRWKKKNKSSRWKKNQFNNLEKVAKCRVNPFPKMVNYCFLNLEIYEAMYDYCRILDLSTNLEFDKIVELKSTQA